MKNALDGTKNPKASHMGVFATHVICHHNNLQNICIYWLAMTRSALVSNQDRICETYKTSSSSPISSEETSKVIQPSGLSSAATRTS